LTVEASRKGFQSFSLTRQGLAREAPSQFASNNGVEFLTFWLKVDRECDFVEIPRQFALLPLSPEGAGIGPVDANNPNSTKGIVFRCPLRPQFTK
jgi:hypothetical protein